MNFMRIHASKFSLSNNSYKDEMFLSKIEYITPNGIGREEYISLDLTFTFYV